MQRIFSKSKAWSSWCCGLVLFQNYIGGICKKKSSFVVNCLIAVCLSPPQSIVKRIEHMEMRYKNTVIIIIIKLREALCNDIPLH